MSKIEIEKPKISRPAKIEKVVKPPAGMMWPDFDSFFIPEDDPMDGLVPTGDVEQDADLVMGIVADTFDADDDRKIDEYRVAVDHEFFLVVCFQSRAQKEEFLQKSGWDELGDKYIDGLEVARKMGVIVPLIALPKRPPRKMPRGLREFKIIGKGGENA